jgi:2-hydroxyglutarate dehydrogenase
VEHGIPVNRCGKVVVATSEHETAPLYELERRGVANGVRGLRRLSPPELADIEPHARGVAALHSPETAIVDFAAVARSFANELLAADHVVATGCKVRSLRTESGRVRVVHDRGETSARAAIVCAGLWADRLAAAAGAERNPVIVPFRGAYLRIRPERRHLVRSLIYPVPDPELPFLGVHLTRRIDGEVLVGPTALLAGARDAYRLRRVTPQGLLSTLMWPGSWRMARRWWRSGVAEIHRAVSRRALVTEARRLLPDLAVEDVLSGPAGVRAQAVGRDGRLMDDFVLSRTERVLHVRNAPSPAATSALALARVITAQAIEDMGLGAEPKAWAGFS